MGKALSFTSYKVKTPLKHKNGTKVMKTLKGSTKPKQSSTSTPKSKPKDKSKALKSVQKVLQSPVILPLPPHVVEFDIDGTQERLGVFEQIPLVDASEASTFVPTTDTNSHSNSVKGSAKGKGRRSKYTKKTEKNKNLTEQLSIPDMSNSSAGPSSPQGDEYRGSEPQATLPNADFRILDDYDMEDAPPVPSSYIQHVDRSTEELAEDVEYDVDECDCFWLQELNALRKKGKNVQIKPDTMEFLMDRFEKEAHRQMQNIGINHSPLVDDDAVCSVCLDGECQNSNVILFCDMCNLAIHQECYGVPYIPEGQWLCRRCLQNPDISEKGSCELCPNKGGALKETSEGLWAHVVCAIWIPEVCFANTVFLEPIDGIKNIPPARWRLTCFICKQKGIGACIQCHKSNCYKAFHATCAQQANLVMTVDTIRHNASLTVKKTAWCDIHAPPGTDHKNQGDESSPRQKLKETRKLLAENREAVPIMRIPNISSSRVAELARNIRVPEKGAVAKKILAYWKLKRQSRNGVPLLRRLQITAASLRISPKVKGDGERQQSPGRPRHQNPGPSRIPANEPANEPPNLYRSWIRLRQDLEKVRLLSELVRKREQAKQLLILNQEKVSAMTLRPRSIFITRLIGELMKKDTQHIFLEPVDTTKVKTYLSIISHPMDLGTMEEKAESNDYSSIEEMEKDFNLMIGNCLKFNTKDTIYYKAAVKLREVGKAIIKQWKEDFHSIGYDPKTGMHKEDK